VLNRVRTSRALNNVLKRREASLGRAWVSLATARQRRALSRRATPPADDSRPMSPMAEDLVRRYAPGRSFADIGCMWQADGAVAFLADECGATAVTALDEADATPAFLDRQARGSAVKFVKGDLHDPDSMSEVGTHEVVWCTGVLYHTPNPCLAVERLRHITGKYLILGTKTIPELPGFPATVVYFPALSPKQRHAYAPLFGSETLRYKPNWRPFSNWWWGLTPSAVRGLVEAPTGWTIKEVVEMPLVGRYDNLIVVAERPD
jgi:hypothetical protein